jgi:acetyltransferase AlgX (SGNH hydrolase-like protein)
MRRKTRIPFVVWYPLAVLLFLEASLQVFYYVTAGQALWTRVGRPLYVANTVSGFFNKPHLDFDHHTNEFRSHIYTNSIGFRVPRADLEYEPEKPQGTKRLMLLGPSFAYGWGVQYEDCFAAKLQELLGVQVINAGVPALGTYPQLKWYESTGRQYHADLVLQIVYGSMNVERRFDDFTVNDAGYLLPNNPTRMERFVAVAKKSALVFYGWTLYSRVFATPTAAIEGAGRRLAIAHTFSTDDARVKEALGYYDELRRIVGESGATPVVVYAPLSYMIHRGDIARWKHLGVTNVDEQLEFDGEFCEYLTSQGLWCINVTPALRTAADTDPERLYYWLDIHWTKRGNQVAAAAVTEALKQLGVTTAGVSPPEHGSVSTPGSGAN